MKTQREDIEDRVSGLLSGYEAYESALKLAKKRLHSHFCPKEDHHQYCYDIAQVLAKEEARRGE